MTHDPKMLVLKTTTDVDFLAIKPDKLRWRCDGNQIKVEAPDTKPYVICMGYKGPFVNVSGNIHVLDLDWYKTSTDVKLKVTQSVYIEMPVNSQWYVKSKKLSNDAMTVNRFVGEIEFVRIES